VSAADELFLEAAVELAEEGRFTCSPNPTVGCIITKNHVVLGRGFHQRTGSGHAEVNAIDSAGGAANIVGATVYVSLEPCAFEGRTPACAATLAAGNVSRVVVAAIDPHREVAGKGIAALKDAGIQVDLLELTSAQRCIEGYTNRIVNKRPYVRVKTASSMDGATALASGESQWITGPQARADVQYWRARSDAIVTGIGTVLADDPQLNVRDERYTHCNQPLRVVLDRQLRIPRDAKLLDGATPTLIVHAMDAEPDQALISKQNVECLGIAGGLPELLNNLADRGCNEVLVEAGTTLVGSFAEGKLWDEWLFYLAPTLLGDDARRLAHLNVATLAEAVSGKVVSTNRIGSDLRVLVRR
jgi:diaminohydroxyphosphoribosylaminopyrimidine deaminase/5-amino-6-(5-phosphoribosylamino)uracil reductase